jgi:hypothetical protein
MRNPEMEFLEVLIGHWSVTLKDCWFLESRDIEQRGSATGRWLGDAFVGFETEMEGEPMWHFVFGRSDANGQLLALYHDPRGTSRLFQMSRQGEQWTLLRQDPDFHQRFVATVTPERIDGRWDASDDQGMSWRKDFDLIFQRTAG